MSKEKEAPAPYSSDGKGFVGEGRGAPEAQINTKQLEEKLKEKKEE